EGILSKQKLGFTPKFGDWETTERLAIELVKRKGIYNLLAEDIYRATQQLGEKAQKLLVHTYKRVAPGIDPRGPMVMGLLMNAVSDTGEFKRAATVFERLFRLDPPRTRKMVIDLFGTDDILDPKKELATKHIPSIYIESIGIASDLTGVCYNISRHFANSGPLGFIELSKALSLGTGIDIDSQGLWDLTTRVRSLQKAYEIREGRNHLDDDFSERIYREPQPVGQFKGLLLDPSATSTMRMNYYQARGWDRHTGVPTRKSLVPLGPEYEQVIEDMERILPQRKNLEGGIVSRYLPQDQATFSNFKPVAKFTPMPKINWIPAAKNNPGRKQTQTTKNLRGKTND
ncbi:MAG: aldehyde ferredoxin oxidoreductase C-terminal domain-containing protein, partial [Candidatus Ranarchaeia archaeon]